LIIIRIGLYFYKKIISSKFTSGNKGVTQWHIETGSFIRLYKTNSPVTNFVYKGETNDLLIIQNDKYVLKYNIIDGLTGYLQTMAKCNYSLEITQFDKNIELLIVGGDSRIIFLYLNRVWLIAALLL